MTGREFEKAFRELQTKYFSANKEAEAAFKRIRRGGGLQSDVYAITKALGDTAEKALIETLGNVDIIDVEAFVDYVVENILTSNYSVAAAFADVVQKGMNEAAGTGLEVKAVALGKKRIDTAKEQFRTVTNSAEIVTAQNGLIATTLQRGLDDFIKANAQILEGAGLEPVYERIWDGITGTHDTKHTDYCNTLAGTYKKSALPKRFYERHERCNCSFNLYPDGKSRERLAVLRKGEKDVNNELWISQQPKSNSRKAVLRRRREQYGAEEARKMLNEEWKGGLNGIAERHFT